MLINKTTSVPFAALSSLGWQFLLTGCFHSVMRLARGCRGALADPGRVGDAPHAAAAARRSERKSVYKECHYELYAIHHKLEGRKGQK